MVPDSFAWRTYRGKAAGHIKQFAHPANCGAICYIAYRDPEVKAQFLTGMSFSVPEREIATGIASCRAPTHRKHANLALLRLISSPILDSNHTAWLLTRQGEI